MTYRDPNIVYSPLVLDPGEVAPPGWEYVYAQQPAPQQVPQRAPYFPSGGGLGGAGPPVQDPPQTPFQRIPMQPQFKQRQQVPQQQQPSAYQQSPLSERLHNYYKRTPTPWAGQENINPPPPDVGQTDPITMQPRFQPRGQQRQPSGYRFSDPVEDAIARAAEANGIPLPLMRAFARIESSGNPEAQTGSYKGLYQLSDQEGRGDLFDPYNNANYAAANFKAQIAAFKAKYGREPTAGELYMQHQQGPGGAAAHMANPDAPAWQNMYSTGEGRQKGEGWSKLAIWGNIPNDIKDQRFPGWRQLPRNTYPPEFNNYTSREFMTMWDDKMRRFGGYDGTPQQSAAAATSSPVDPVQSAAAGGPVQGKYPTPTEQDLQYLEQNASEEVIKKFEQRYGPIDQYFDVEEPADTSKFVDDDEAKAAWLASGLDGVLLGGGDEVIPWLTSLWRNDYDTERALYQKLTGKMAANRPKWDTALRVAGGLAAPVGIAGKAAKSLFGNPLTKPGTLKTLAKLATGGAAYGGVAGYNEGEGGFADPTRVAGGVRGAVTGAALAPVFGAAAGAARNAYRLARPLKVSDRVAARLADPVLKDLAKVGGPAGVDTTEALINQTGKATANAAQEVAGGSSTAAKKLAQAIVSTGVKPTGSNLVRWVWSWFKANRDTLSPKEQKEFAELLMNPKKVEQAMQRIMQHREGEMARLGSEFKTNATIANTMSSVTMQKEADRRRINNGRTAP